MQQATQLDKKIVAEFQQYTKVFKHTQKELLTMAVGISAGLAMAGKSSAMLEFAITSDNIPLMIEGGLLGCSMQ
jgi:sulfopyruvate decarboxylase TPP-binding subunit